MGLFTRGKTQGRRRVEPRLDGRGRPLRQEKRVPARRTRRRASLLIRLLSLAFSLALLGMIAGGAGFAYIWMSLDQKGLFQIPEREPGIMLLAADGGVLAERGAFFGDEVRIEELPDYVPNAIIAIEDRRFREHFGIDPWGLGRAIFTNLRAGQLQQGGSTLTQQLAKNLFLSQDRTLARKAQEAVLAIWLENKFSKDEILQLYLNRIEFRAGVKGVEKAAMAFFGKPAREVTLQEAAILAAVLKAPSTYNPLVHPEAAAARARQVLADMVEVGFITADEAKQAIEAPLELKPSDYVPATQYVVDYAVEQLPALVQSYGQSIIVETTIDPELQDLAEKSLRQRLNKDGAKLDVTQGSFVMMDAGGAIKALVGGKSYVKSQFNRVTKAKRQPGSAFKPFVYLAALEQGYSPYSIEIDEPVKIGDWEPENYKRKYLGPVTLKTAFARSLNTIAAKLAYNIGPEAVIATAHRLGIGSELQPNASIALGTSEVTLLELASAVTPFANGGSAAAPYIINRITTRDGEVLYEREPAALSRIVSPFDVGGMNVLMRAVVREGTAKTARFGEIDMGGKTGTSQDYRDAWFVGFTAHYVAGVWVGNDDNSPTKKVTGGSIPAAIWRDVMEPAHASLEPLPLPGDEVTEEMAAPVVVNDFESGAPPPPPRKQARVEEEAGSGGFLDDLFGGDSKPKKKKKDGKPKSEFQKLQQRQRER